ncbi:uncharacterized protein LOC130900626 isoform X1 [Diorhabda carinulata]|uniref:uncharacterized protein LOC130900626 isoform X1 n=1 Tax=Diorhabda carinulata TaxID=1163345 RepID=UPI0025A2350D|nr:uncharacterized protein LOC130900626 isoform X1 [Diorhabda carinulata]
MTENASANITQILTSFDTFVKILEDPEWIVTANTEDIKTTFKLGTFIEKTVEHFKSIKTFDSFLSVLTQWWLTKQKTKQYSEQFYSAACDELLCTFFRFPDINQNTLEIAVRIYTSLFPKKRFELVLTKLFSDAGNIEAIMDYLKTVDTKHFEYYLKLQLWDNLLQVGEENLIIDEIKDILAPYNVDQYLYILIGILTLIDISDSEKLIQDIILQHLLKKMSERSILTKQLWFCLIKKINKADIHLVCLNSNEFFKSYLNFIVYIGGMMIKVGNRWKSDPDISFYPDITYDNIFCNLHNLIKSDKLKSVVVDRLLEAKDNTTNIWNQVLFELSDT